MTEPLHIVSALSTCGRYHYLWTQILSSTEMYRHHSRSHILLSWKGSATTLPLSLGPKSSSFHIPLRTHI